MFFAFALASQILQFKSSEISIVPPDPLPLGGYTARQGAVFQSGGEDLKARTLTFTQNNQVISLVVVEMLTIPESLVEKVKILIPQDVKLMMVATHTHCAPDSQMLNNRMTFQIPGIATYNRQWEAWYANKIATGINNSISSLPKSINEMTTSQTEVNLNRGRREGAIPDKTLRKIQFGNQKVLNYSAHATIFEENHLQLSGDWPGKVMSDGKTILLPAAIGDVSPASEGASAEIKITSMANQISNANFEKNTKLASPSIEFHTQNIELGKPTPHPDFAKQNGINDAIAGLLVQKFAPSTAELTGFMLGNNLIIGVPGEPSSELGRQMQLIAKDNGINSCWVVSHTNGWVGYILMPDDYKKGGYEATLSMHGPNLSTRILEATKKLVTQFRGP